MQDLARETLIRASEGDLAAFEEVYKMTAGFVYNVAFRIVNNHEDAEEVAQEVFLIIYSKLKEFRFEASFKTWVYRITVNRAISYARHTYRSRHNIVECDEKVLEETIASNAGSEMDKEGNSRVVRGLLNAISPDQRACVVLRSIEGLSYQQIAQALKINVNTVRTRLKRAREKLLALKKEVMQK